MRYPSIDILRGLAILFMIQVHFGDNLSAREDPYGLLYDVSEFLGMIPAPLFTLLSGVSYALWLRNQESTGRPDAEITKITVRRGLFLFGVGIAFNVFVWLPEDTFDWDILTLLGTSLILLAFARKLPVGVLVLLCLMVLLLSPLLRVATDYAAYWEDDEYSYDFTLEDVMFGFIANGYFPVLPWIIFPLMGFVLGDTVYSRRGRPASSVWWLVVSGFSLMALACAGVLFRMNMHVVISRYCLTGWTLFPASTEYVVGMLGASMLSVVALHRWLDQNPNLTGKGRILTMFRRFSAFSLTIYVVHHMMHLWPLWLYGTWMQGDPTIYWRQAISTPTALTLSLACMVACYWLAVLLERYKSPGLESLMRWVCE